MLAGRRVLIEALRANGSPFAGAAWLPEVVRDAMMAGDPAVHINVERGGLLINTHCLQEGDEMTLAASLATALDGAP